MDRHLTIVEHLEELRRRILVCVISLVVAVAVCFPLAGRLLGLLQLPAAGLIEKLVYFSPEEALLVYMRISFFCAILVTMPIILQQAWLFLSPAVALRHRKYASAFIGAGAAMFLAGCCFAYFLMLPAALKFLMGVAGAGLQPVISATNYIAFITNCMLYTGVIFQMPIAGFILTRAGLVNARFLRRQFRFAVVIISVVSAVITPTTDAFNMLLLAVPMLALYEVTIWVSFFAGRAHGPLQTPA
ncbi:MAG TPA: twin-arginine translocase subunit TatC [Patescibacteria group bacterium]|nr:twin-arginine translocase subunit TatC [Patescibacteria group bacterium]